MTISIQLIKIPDSETLSHREFYAEKFPVTIGREFDCDLVLPDSSSKISRRHAELRQAKNGHVEICDVSTNGIILNSAPILKGASVTLADGDLLKIEGYELLFGVVEMPSAERPILPKKEKKLVTGNPFENASHGDGSGVIDPVSLSELPAEFEQAPFIQGVEDLESDLLFDPFAEGPAINERAVDQVVDFDNTIKRQDKLVNPTHFEMEVLDEPEIPEPRAPLRANLPSSFAPKEREYREVAMDAAIERFLETFDPNNLKAEYSEFLGPFSRTKKRFWNIHCRIFARRKANGEYARIFKAIIAEEMRKR